LLIRLHPLAGRSVLEAGHGPPAWPVRTGGSTGRVGSFGLTRDNGKKRHLGVDYLAEAGLPVYAAHDGEVTRTGEQSGGKGYGQRIYLRDAEAAVQTRYAHLSGQLVSRGDRVRAGALLGWVGRSGNVQDTTPTHLHFEVRLGPLDRLEAVDPEEWLAE
jgi:murein DD-endopeptidase MepM/ murein hydrolase activator NlpD